MRIIWNFSAFCYPSFIFSQSEFVEDSTTKCTKKQPTKNAKHIYSEYRVHRVKEFKVTQRGFITSIICSYNAKLRLAII